jgi:hypothetical protein
MQTTIDGFVASPNGQLDWAIFDWEDELNAYVDASPNRSISSFSAALRPQVDAVLAHHQHAAV